MLIPLEKRLKKRMHIEIALLQDEIMEILYGIENNLVMHGGTAIWRCYGGNRFSEDLDFYLSDISSIEKKFKKKVDERGLKILKFKKTGNLIFCKVTDNKVEVRVEINYATEKPFIIKNYEKTDGSFMNILTLSPEDLIIEKISAYENRRFIRDIYDIYHLTNYVTDNKKIKEKIKKFVCSVKAPADEENLKTIVYSGQIPSFKKIVEALKRGLT